MEVVSVYLDLQKAELNKKGKKSVWKLESEAFKEPLELKIGFETSELNEFNNRIEDVKSDLSSSNTRIQRLEEDNYSNNHSHKLLNEKLVELHNENKNLITEIEKNKSEINQLYKVIADAKTTIDMLSGTILQLQDKMKEIDKKITKQPMVFSDKSFISGHESCGLTTIEIPS